MLPTAVVSEMRWPGGWEYRQGTEGKSTVTQGRNKKELENKKERGRKQTRGAVSTPGPLCRAGVTLPPTPTPSLGRIWCQLSRKDRAACDTQKERPAFRSPGTAPELEEGRSVGYGAWCQEQGRGINWAALSFRR